MDDKGLEAISDWIDNKVVKTFKRLWTVAKVAFHFLIIAGLAVGLLYIVKCGSDIIK